MAGKRQATSHLDHENWEQEDEPEERGTFKTAPPEELRARVIKKATRRQPATGATKEGDVVDTPRKSVFSGFSGFGKPATASATAGNAAGSPFAFLSKLPAVTAPATDADCFAKPSSSTDVKRTPPAKMFSLDANFRNDFKTNNANAGTASSTATTTTTTSTSIFGNTSASAGGNSTAKSPKTYVPMFKSSVVSVDQSATNSNLSRYSAEYPDEVGALNMAIVKFLQESVDKNQYCILTPVFDSYDKFLKKLQEKYDRKPSTTTMFASTVTVPTSSTAPPAASFKLGTASTTGEKTALSAPAAGFSFSIPSTSASDKSASSSPAAGFMFGKPSSTAASATEKAAPAVGFSFGISSTTTNTTEKASSSLSAAPGGFSFLKPSTPISTTSSSDTASPSLIFDKKPNSTATTSGTTSTITTPLFSLGPVQTANVSPTKTEATSSTASGASIFSLGAKSDSNKDQLPKPSFFFGVNNSGAAAATSSPKTNGFIFGLKGTDDKPSTSGFTGFGKADTAAGETKSPASSGFSFASAASTFSFGNVKPPTAAEIQAAEKEEEEDSPPVVQFKQVVEDDAIFSKRCKVFVKKGADYTDRGVGTLYLKPVKDTKKTQLLVRADTNLGNILVNLILSEGLPCQRMGKNNVMMVCLPTPEEAKPLSMLLRVKTAEEADDLLQQIKKHTV
ncbi:nuclear pore complex protein Nup50 [Drosophila grimshawi]|uniref:nuclear pore complex protein Nup50 n=1 Tax=Drosophila grimshawi TaxID=7222 RepID=UPI000C870F02|nr:nuclear pore complex protein Nup50 [Drosophila grimshawi]